MGDAASNQIIIKTYRPRNDRRGFPMRGPIIPPSLPPFLHSFSSSIPSPHIKSRCQRERGTRNYKARVGVLSWVARHGGSPF